MNLVQHLIDKWRETRSQSELARQLGVTPHRVIEWKKGLRPMPEAQFARLAELVEGQDRAKSLLWDYVHEKQHNARKTLERISQSFKKVLLLANPRRYLLSRG